jgi:selenide,water dikinase
MLRASKCSAVLDLDALPVLPGAISLLSRGIRSTAHPENAKTRRAMSIADPLAAHPALDLLFDPQTSGGLLLGIPAERAEALLAAVRAAGDEAAAIIGVVAPPRADGALIEVGAGG